MAGFDAVGGFIFGMPVGLFVGFGHTLHPWLSGLVRQETNWGICAPKPGCSNPHQTSAFLRVLLDELDAWAPQAPAETVQHTFPAITGVACPDSVDADDNDVAGLRSPDILVPRATYTGWNLRAEGYSRRTMYSIVGRYLPFAADAEARRDSGDPHPALTERYRSKAYYVRQVALAVQALIEAGVLLEEDADRYLDAAMRVKR